MKPIASSLKKINKIDKLIARLIKKRERYKLMPITNIRKDRMDITTDPRDIKKVIKEH